MICPNCGKEINSQSNVCVYCWNEVSDFGSNSNSDSRKAIAIILLLLCGVFGINRFYLGYIGSGIVILLLTLISGVMLSPIALVFLFSPLTIFFPIGVGVLSCLTVVIWCIVDLFLIALGKLKPQELGV